MRRRHDSITHPRKLTTLLPPRSRKKDLFLLFWEVYLCAIGFIRLVLRTSASQQAHASSGWPPLRSPLRQSMRIRCQSLLICVKLSCECCLNYHGACSTFESWLHHQKVLSKVEIELSSKRLLSRNLVVDCSHTRIHLMLDGYCYLVEVATDAKSFLH